MDQLRQQNFFFKKKHLELVLQIRKDYNSKEIKPFIDEIFLKQNQNSQRVEDDPFEDIKIESSVTMLTRDFTRRASKLQSVNTIKRISEINKDKMREMFHRITEQE